MTTSNPDNPQGHPPERPPQEPRTIKEALINGFRDIIARLSPAKRQQAEDYMKKQPEKIDPNTPIPADQQAKRDGQKTALASLKSVLTGQAEAARGTTTREILTHTQAAIGEMTRNTSLPAYHRDFFLTLANNLPIQDASQVMPYARFVAQVADLPTSSSPLESAKQKAQVALEVFVGEQTDTTSIEAVGRIVALTGATHGVSKELQTYLESPEGKNLLQKYNLTPEQQAELSQAASETEPIDTSTPETTAELSKQREALLASITDPQQKASLDVYILSMSPKRLLDLMHTVPDERIGGQSAGSVSDIKKTLMGAEFKKDFDPFVDKLFEEYESESHHADLSGEQKAVIKSYLLKLRNDMYTTKIQTFDPRGYIVQKESQAQGMYRLGDEAVMPVIMFGGQDPFLFEQYFRGKASELILTDEAKKQAYFQSAQDGTLFEVNQEEIYQKMFRQVTNLNLYKMSQPGSEMSGIYDQYIGSSIRKMKEKTNAKEDFNLGGVNITFAYRDERELVDYAGNSTYPFELHDRTLAHVTGVYVGIMDKMAKAYQQISQFVEIAETGGDAEKLLQAAAGISNEMVDLFVSQSPIVLQAEQSFMRIIKDKLSANGGQLPADFFRRGQYAKQEIPKLLENDVRAAYGSDDMTDPEKDVYLKIGQALAITSGEFLSVLANALPPMTAAIHSDKLSTEVKNKIKKNESLSIEEAKEIYRTISSEFRDFPYRSLFMAMNPMRWLFSWVHFNDYNLHLLSFLPVKPGEAAKDPFTVFKEAQKMERSAYLGIEDDVAHYFEDDYMTPFYTLSQFSQKISLEKRGGVRRQVIDMVKKHYVTCEGANGTTALDGPATIAKLAKISPMLAYRFATAPANKEHPDYIADLYNGMKVDWRGRDKSGKLQGEVMDKEARMAVLLEEMHTNYPNFFMGMEMPHLFRRKELTFTQNIRKHIAEELATHTDKNGGYWALASANEKSEDITNQADASPLGQKYVYDTMLTRVVLERTSNMMRELETYMQRYTTTTQKGKSLKDFFSAEHPEIENPELYKKLYDPHPTNPSKSKGVAINALKLFKLSGSPEQVRDAFIHFAKKVYYEGKNGESSIFGSKRYTGMFKENIGSPKTLSSYYAELIAKGKVESPFDWTYLNDVNFNFQGTGVSMIQRNIGDFAKILGFTQKYMGFYTALQNGISQPEGSVETIKKAFDEIKTGLFDVSTSYSPTDSSQLGYLSSAFLMYPFTPNRFRDSPLLAIPGLGGVRPHSWATVMNVDDFRRNNSWEARQRKEVLDHVLHKPYNEFILSPLHHNEKVTGLVHKTVKVPWIVTKDVENKNGEFVKKTVLGMKEVKLPGYTRTQEKYNDWAVKDFKKFAKVEDWWVGGEHNFGLGLDVWATIFTVGILLLLFQFMKEGLKETEIK
ncbi:MAG: hypothetical protein NUV65_00385 [Candidatus Roizmanbacteria bacterium]|nr:hypothetical protein [Candidatus Roizmanbacteria bacterium]